jgi:hypothetical protein
MSTLLRGAEERAREQRKGGKADPSATLGMTTFGGVGAGELGVRRRGGCGEKRTDRNV